MAMLAEPRKRKTYNLVPRGKPLFEDDDRFGTKMLKKMGWSKEKGLGAKETGTTEFVRVSYKNNVKGLGFEERDDQWTQHEEQFTGLLQTLNGGEDAKCSSELDEPSESRVGFGFSVKLRKKQQKLKEKFSGESLEEKSKRSKARVHYKKFTKGKDLSQYSEKDLANIFGKKPAAEEDEQQNGIYEQLTAYTAEADNGADKDDNFAGVQTISTGMSVDDYFKQKMTAMRNKLKKATSAATEESEQVEIAAPVANHMEEEVRQRKKKNKKRKAELDEPEVKSAIETVQPTVPEIADDAVSVDEEPRQKKKKNKKCKVEINAPEVEPAIVTKPAPVPEAADVTEKVTLPVDEQARQKKKKIKKHKAQSSESEVESANEIATATVTETLDAGDTAGSAKPKTSKKEQRKALKSIKQEQPAVDNKAVGPTKKHKTESEGTKEETFAAAEQTDTRSAPVHSDDDMDSTEELIKCEEDRQRTDESDLNKLSRAELQAKLDAYDVFTISTFTAERFRHCDFAQFVGSNLAEISGYAQTENLKLEVKQIRSDEKRIMQLWNGTLNKYANSAPKYTYRSYTQQVRNARAAKAKKMPRLHVKTWKRRQAFNNLL